jgi:membrane protein
MRTQTSSDGVGNPAEPAPEALPGMPARRVAVRTLSKAWDDGIFAMAAQAAYWETLSLPPLLLGLLGSMGYVATWVGPESLVTVQHGIVRFTETIFNREVVDQFIAPTVTDILNKGRPDIISVGFPIALFAGSSAISSLVDSITFAHEQYSVRHPVWQRAFALLIYLVALVVAVVTFPLLALGPELLHKVLPGSWAPAVLNAINAFYYPVVVLLIVFGLTTLYKAALPRSLPFHRLLPGAALAMLVFAVSAFGLRVYIGAITSTGYTYGALATPIAFLLFAFLIGFAVVLGAQLNNAIQETWPVPLRERERRVRRLFGLRHEGPSSRGDQATAEPGGPTDPAEVQDTPTADGSAPPGGHAGPAGNGVSGSRPPVRPRALLGSRRSRTESSSLAAHPERPGR